VIGQGEFAVRALDLDISRGTLDAQYLVIIPFCIACRNTSTPDECVYECFGLRATLTMAGRISRSFNLYPL
jgi:hypothetical protein